MKMAICPQDGIEAMLKVTGILGDVFEDVQFPRSVDGEFEPESPDYFDYEKSEHLLALYDRLDHFMGRESAFCGDLRRVVFGYSTLLSPENRLVDLEDDALALHPRFAALETAARETLEYLRVFSFVLDGGPSDPKTEGVHAVIGKLAAALDLYDGDSKSPMADGKESEVVK